MARFSIFNYHFWIVSRLLENGAPFPESCCSLFHLFSSWSITRYCSSLTWTKKEANYQAANHLHGWILQTAGQYRRHFIRTQWENISQDCFPSLNWNNYIKSHLRLPVWSCPGVCWLKLTFEASNCWTENEIENKNNSFNNSETHTLSQLPSNLVPPIFPSKNVTFEVDAVTDVIDISFPVLVVLIVILAGDVFTWDIPDCFLGIVPSPIVLK